MKEDNGKDVKGISEKDVPKEPIMVGNGIDVEDGFTKAIKWFKNRSKKTDVDEENISEKLEVVEGSETSSSEEVVSDLGEKETSINEEDIIGDDKQETPHVEDIINTKDTSNNTDETIGSDVDVSLKKKNIFKNKKILGITVGGITGVAILIFMLLGGSDIVFGKSNQKLGDEALAKGDYAGAIEAYKLADEEDKDFVFPDDIYFDYAEKLASGGDFDNAIAQLEVVISKESPSGKGKSVAYMKEIDYFSAKKDLEGLADCYNRARAYSDSPDLDKAFYKGLNNTKDILYQKVLDDYLGYKEGGYNKVGHPFVNPLFVPETFQQINENLSNSKLDFTSAELSFSYIDLDRNGLEELVIGVVGGNTVRVDNLSNINADNYILLDVYTANNTITPVSLIQDTIPGNIINLYTLYEEGYVGLTRYFKYSPTNEMIVFREFDCLMFLDDAELPKYYPQSAYFEFDLDSTNHTIFDYTLTGAEDITAVFNKLYGNVGEKEFKKYVEDYRIDINADSSYKLLQEEVKERKVLKDIVWHPVSGGANVSGVKTEKTNNIPLAEAGYTKDYGSIVDTISGRWTNGKGSYFYFYREVEGKGVSLAYQTYDEDLSKEYNHNHSGTSYFTMSLGDTTELGLTYISGGKNAGGYAFVTPEYIELGAKGDNTISMMGMDWTYVSNEPLFEIGTKPWL